MYMNVYVHTCNPVVSSVKDLLLKAVMRTSVQEVAQKDLLLEAVRCARQAPGGSFFFYPPLYCYRCRSKQVRSDVCREFLLLMFFNREPSFTQAALGE